MSDLADQGNETPTVRIGVLLQFERALWAEHAGTPTVEVPTDWLLAVTEELAKRRDAMDDALMDVAS